MGLRILPLGLLVVDLSLSSMLCTVDLDDQGRWPNTPPMVLVGDACGSLVKVVGPFYQMLQPVGGIIAMISVIIGHRTANA